MNIAPEELRDAARRLLDKTVQIRNPANHEAAGEQALRGLMAEQGWMLLTIPEADGGLGQDFAALVPIYEELGRSLAPAGFAATMATVDLIGSLDGTLAADLGAGTAGMASAFVDAALLTDGTIRITDVPGALGATHLILLAKGGEPVVGIVPLDRATRTAVRMWDESRSMADIDVATDDVAVLLRGDAARDAIAAFRAHLELALACDSLGGADRSLAAAIDYMGTRRQFDRPIGSFQALKHRAADLKTTLEIARAFTLAACAAFAARDGDWAIMATQAKLLATEAYRAIAQESIQFHGGVGFTWELDCHLFLKRAMLNEMLLGDADAARDRIADAVIARMCAGKAA